MPTHHISWLFSSADTSSKARSLYPECNRKDVGAIRILQMTQLSQLGKGVKISWRSLLRTYTPTFFSLSLSLSLEARVFFHQELSSEEDVTRVPEDRERKIRREKRKTHFGTSLKLSWWSFCSRCSPCSRGGVCSIRPCALHVYTQSGTNANESVHCSERE